MKTIARTHARRIAAVRESIVLVQRYDEGAEEYVESTVEAAFATAAENGGKLLDRENGVYTVEVWGVHKYDMYDHAGLAKLARTRLRNHNPEFYAAANMDDMDDAAVIAEAVNSDLLPA